MCNFKWLSQNPICWEQVEGGLRGNTAFQFSLQCHCRKGGVGGCFCHHSLLHTHLTPSESSWVSKERRGRIWWAESYLCSHFQLQDFLFPLQSTCIKSGSGAGSIRVKVGCSMPCLPLPCSPGCLRKVEKGKGLAAIVVKELHQDGPFITWGTADLPQYRWQIHSGHSGSPATISA